MKSIKIFPWRLKSASIGWNMILGVAGQKAISRTCFKCSSIWWNWFSLWGNFTPADAVSGELFASLHMLCMQLLLHNAINKSVRKINIAMAIKHQRMQTKINGKLKDDRQFWRWLLANKVENCISRQQSFWIFHKFWLGAVYKWHLWHFEEKKN